MPKGGQRRFGFHPRVLAGGDPAGLTVYAISDETAIKIGKSRGHPRLRLRELQTGNPRLLSLVAYTQHIGGPRWDGRGLDLEQRLHCRYWRHHLRGEWFALHPDILDELRSWDWLDEGLWGCLDLLCPVDLTHPRWDTALSLLRVC